MKDTSPAAVAARFRRASRELRGVVEQITREHGVRLQAVVRANMSGRSGVIFQPDDGGPGGEIGPRAQTGDLRRSVSMTLRAEGDVITATVGTNAPQAHRLEYGFVGTDSAGRHVHSPPYPAFRPALLHAEVPYRKALGDALTALMRGEAVTSNDDEGTGL